MQVKLVSKTEAFDSGTQLVQWLADAETEACGPAAVFETVSAAGTSFHNQTCLTHWHH